MSVDVIASSDWMLRHESEELAANLIDEFCPPLNPDEVRRCCAKAIAPLQSVEFHSYIVVLVEHEVRQQLRELRDQRIRTIALWGGRP